MDETMIDPVEMRTAVGTCIKDPALQNLFRSAPDGAREVIKLSFYSTVFPEKIDAHRFRVCLRAIEPSLTADDLRYLIRFEDDAWLKKRFAELLAQREKDEVAGGGAQGVSSDRRFHVRREEVSRPAVDLNAEAVKRNLAMNESERRANEARRAEGRRIVRRSALLRTGVCVVLGLSILAGGAVWLNVRSKRQREQAEAAQQAAERMRIKEANEREKWERQNAERLKRKQEERAVQQAKQAAEMAERAFRREKHEKEIAERKRQSDELDKKRKEISERITKICGAFNGARLLPWGSLPKAQRPGAVERTFLCLVPEAQNRYGCYEVKSQTNGVLTVAQLLEGKGVESVDLGDWNKRLETFGGLIHNGIVAYLFLPKQMGGESPWGRNDVMPSQMRLGELANVVRTAGVNTDAIAFDVRIRVPGALNATKVGVVKFGDFLESCQIVRKIQDVAAAKVKKQKPKSVRRTIVLYDGSVTKRQINGVTLLPTNPTRLTKQYLEMRAEAQRQEQACRDAEREVEESYNDQVRQKYEDMLNSVLISIAVCPLTE